MDIKVPRLGEGNSAGTVVSILVKEGTAVKKDQTVLELETDKAVAPIPATEAGVISKILVKEGDKVSVGQSIMTIASNGASATTTTAPAQAAPAPQQQARPAQQAAPQPVQQAPAAAPQQDYSYQSKSGFPPPASPSIRKMAQELGIDLSRVRGSQNGGRIVVEDIKNYIQQLQSGAFAGQAAPSAAAPSSAPAKAAAEPLDFSKYGPTTRKKLTNLRKAIANKMVEGWTAIPHVTQFEEANITSLLALRKKYGPIYEKKKAKLTLTVFIMKAVANAMKKYPVFNSSLDESTDEVIYKEYINLGIAVDTEAGLIVPVIKNVDKKKLVELSIELQEIAEKTRQRKTSMEELSGGNFNISNLGSIGGTFFTPIVAKPHVAILGIGRGVTKPVLAAAPAAKGKTAAKPVFEAASMLPLGLSYDHRVIDGADGARFIMEIVKGLENYNEKEVKI